MIKLVRLWAVCFGAVMLGGCISYNRGSVDASEISDVRMRMTTLEDRVSRLEQKVEGMQAKSAQPDGVSSRIESLEKSVEAMSKAPAKE